MVLVVPAGHPWADREIEPAALLGEPLSMREFGSGSRHVVEQHSLCVARGGAASARAGHAEIGPRTRLTLVREFSLGLPAGPEPGGNAGAFRALLPAFAAEAARSSKPGQPFTLCTMPLARKPASAFAK